MSKLSQLKRLVKNKTGEACKGASITCALRALVKDVTGSDSNARTVEGALKELADYYEPAPKVATPTATPAAGEVTIGTTVTLNCATTGATIHYTTDGSTPTAESSTYSDAITISAATTIKAIAVKEGMTNSNVLTAAYTISKVETPVATPEAGEVESGTEIELTCGTDGADIYYTTNGDTPTTSSTKYTAKIALTTNTTIKAIAAKDNYANSDVLSAAYTISE